MSHYCLQAVITTVTTVITLVTVVMLIIMAIILPVKTSREIIPPIMKPHTEIALIASAQWTDILTVKPTA